MKNLGNRNFLLKCNNALGLNRVIDLPNKDLPNIGFAVLRAAQEETFHLNTYDKELCLVILSGKWKINISRDEFLCERTSVFDQKPYAIYLPSDTEFELKAEKEGEIAFCESKGTRDNRKKIVFIKPSDVKERFLGRDNFQRIAFDILDETVEAGSLLVGETISKPGNWSSFPPHKHDIDNMPYETALEELYFFMFKPREGFGIQRIYTDDRSLDELFLIGDHSVVLIPSGYHPVVASPGYSLYYLWVLVGEKRILKPSFDPTYKWINKG
jgi:5-deoxy-glucuronate isomerase